MVSAGASFEGLSLDRQPTTGSGKERQAPRRARRDRNRAPQARARGEEAGGTQRTPRGYASAQRPRATPCRGVCAGCTTPCRPASAETDESVSCCSRPFPRLLSFVSAAAFALVRFRGCGATRGGAPRTYTPAWGCSRSFPRLICSRPFPPLLSIVSPRRLFSSVSPAAPVARSSTAGRGRPRGEPAGGRNRAPQARARGEEARGMQRTPRGEAAGEPGPTSQKEFKANQKKCKLVLRRARGGSGGGTQHVSGTVHR